MDQKILPKIKELLKKDESKKFKQTIEVAISFKAKSVNLGGEDKLNLNIHLPKEWEKKAEIGVFADGDLNLKAKKMSSYVLNKKEIAAYSKDKRKMRKFANSCSYFLAQADLMPLIGKTWGVVLGPRGKMPQPIPPNMDPTSIIKKLKNTIKVKTKKTPTIHAPIGLEDMPAKDLAENLSMVLKEVKKQIPPEKISSIYIKRTMGKSIRVA